MPLVLWGFLCVTQAAAQQDICNTLTLVKTDAADNIVANTMLSNIFEAIGYEVDTVRASSSEEAYDLLSQASADAYLSTWVPLDKESLKPYSLKGSIKTLSRVLQGARVGLATNKFGQAAGLERFDQIASFGESLGHTIYVGQHDWLFGQKMQNVIDSNIYGLSKFQIKRVHDFDFSEYLSTADEKQMPMVFFTRNPSFIGYHYAANFLEDNRDFFKLFQDNAAAYVSVRYDFPKKCNNAAEVLRRFNLSAETQQMLMKTAEGDKFKLKAASVDFVKNNKAMVKSWLKGLKAADGSQAAVAFYNAQ